MHAYNYGVTYSAAVNFIEQDGFITDTTALCFLIGRMSHC